MNRGGGRRQGARRAATAAVVRRLITRVTNSLLPVGAPRPRDPAGLFSQHSTRSPSSRLDSVPVRYSEFDNELAEREALIEFNRQREKTPGQIVNEAEEVLQIERERGKRRMSKGGSGGVEGSSDLTNHDEDESHDSWEKAAEKVDVGATSLKKGKKVKDKAESDDEPEEVREATRLM